MTKEEEMKFLTKELEGIFTIDGKGRPSKAKSFLNLIANYGNDLILEKIKEVGQRKCF